MEKNTYTERAGVEEILTGKVDTTNLLFSGVAAFAACK